MISIIVPVYNEEESLEEFNKRTLNVLRSHSKNFEIIYVDDGSKDQSLSIIKNFSLKSKEVKFISFFRNFGQHAAVLSGFKYSKGDHIITLDADLQNPPEEIPEFLNHVESNYDVIAGKRKNRKDNFLRKFFSNIMNRIISKITNVELSDYGCMMRMYSRNIINVILENFDKTIYVPAFASWISKNILEIEIKHEKRNFGKTKYSLMNLTQQAFDLITAYTYKPLQFLLILSLLVLFMIFTFLFFIYVGLINFININNVFLLYSLLILIVSIILVFLSILSEYVLRIHKNSRRLPLYIIREKDLG
tara:strand:+ start:438 stop:1352 length:915 start_codon:yes stop_codon:yes gene_type:complete